MNSQSKCCRCCCPQAGAVALVRWGLGVIFLFFGIGKFQMGISVFADMMAKQFEKTWLPAALVGAFDHVLPFWEFGVGALLLLGIFRNAALFAAGVLLVLLTFGQVVLMGGQIIFQNFVYLAVTAALLFQAEHDKWVLFPRCKSVGDSSQAAAANPEKS